jgi:hypothetical protein
MNRVYLAIISLLLCGCVHNVPVASVNGYNALGNIAKRGFAVNRAEAKKLNGKRVKVWGYIDYANTYTCAMKNWYFSLKASRDDEAGESIHINTPAEFKFAKIYNKIRAMQKNDQNEELFVEGVLHTFEAPNNFSSSVGIEIDVESPEDIKFK